MSIELLHSSTGSLLDYNGEIGAVIVARDFGFNLMVAAGVGCELTVIWPGFLGVGDLTTVPLNPISVQILGGPL